MEHNAQFACQRDLCAPHAATLRDIEVPVSAIRKGLMPPVEQMAYDGKLKGLMLEFDPASRDVVYQSGDGVSFSCAGAMSGVVWGENDQKHAAFTVELADEGEQERRIGLKDEQNRA